MTSSSPYTNEMQAENLRAQAAELGISKFGKPMEPGSGFEAPRPTITYEEGLERTREMTLEFAAQRRVIDADENEIVALATHTPGVIPKESRGGPIENPDAK